MRLSNNKAIITGKHIELFTYDLPFSYDYKVKKYQGVSLVSLEERKQRQEEYMLSSKSRAINKIYRLVKGNMYDFKDIHFITLTFREDMTNLKDANKIFKLFMKRYSYYLGEQVRYVAVPEFQGDTYFKSDKLKPNRGSVHYHLIVFNHRFTSVIYFKDKIWKQGGVDIQKGYRSIGLCRYMTKYISKSFEDLRYKGQKRYFFSLPNHTIVHKDDYTVHKILETLKNEKAESTISYYIYDYLIRNKEQRENIPKNRVTKREYFIGDGGLVISPPKKGETPHPPIVF